MKTSDIPEDAPSDPYSDDPAIRCIQIALRMLMEEIYPRITEDMPKPRSDKERAAIRAASNYTTEAIDRCSWTLNHLNQPHVFTDEKGWLRASHRSVGGRCSSTPATPDKP